MSATAEQRKLLDILDVLGTLSSASDDLRAVITRLANRARTLDEADDIRILIGVRGRLEAIRTAVAAGHPDHR